MISDHRRPCLLFILSLFLDMKMIAQRCHFHVIFFFGLHHSCERKKMMMIYDHRHLRLLFLLLLDTKTTTHGRRFHIFSFWPSSFLWKAKNNNNLWSLSSLPGLVLIPFRHKKRHWKVIIFIFFLFGLCRSYERQEMMTIYDCHCLCVLLLLSLFLNTKTTQSCHLCVFSFWPFLFLWKVKDGNNLWLSSSSPLHVLTFLRHKTRI